MSLSVSILHWTLVHMLNTDISFRQVPATSSTRFASKEIKELHAIQTMEYSSFSEKYYFVRYTTPHNVLYQGTPYLFLKCYGIESRGNDCPRVQRNSITPLKSAVIRFYLT